MLKIRRKSKLIRIDKNNPLFGNIPDGRRVLINQHRVLGVFKKNTYRPVRNGTDQMLSVPEGVEVLVKMRNVDITYGSGKKRFRAIKDLSLNIYKGEVLGLVGESGSGKSTTGKALVGLIPYSYGNISLLDKTLPKRLKRGFKYGKKLKEYKAIKNFLVNKVQMIFQDPANSLNPHVNVQTVVQEGLENTKNARQIYMFNHDQNVLRETFNRVSEQYKRESFSAQMYSDINKKLQISTKVSTKVLYDYLPSILHSEVDAYNYLMSTKANRDQELKKSERLCKKLLVQEILKSVGLDQSVLRRFPLEFSGGQQQRIGIARVVVLRPQLLVADEPISALDVSIQAQVVNIFNELKQKFDLTILFIAHDLRMVEYISDRIAVMNNGTLLEVGKTSEIMNNPHHPYTKSLLDAVPAIDANKGSLIGYVYDPAIHNYNSDNQPEWVKINDDHFVLGTRSEVARWSLGQF